jgi:hypothetical protein
MPGVCSICTHTAADTINKALTAHTVSVVSLAREHGTTRDLLNYHRRAHLASPPFPSTSTAANRHSRADRRTGSTDRARERFLKVYATCGNVTTAAKAAGVGRATVYVWQEHHPDFAIAMRDADLQATEVLEREAWRRAREGHAEPVFQHGKQVGTIQRYSDQLLMFLLRARAPERYRDRVDVSLTPTIKAVAGFDPADVV